MIFPQGRLPWFSFGYPKRLAGWLYAKHAAAPSRPGHCLVGFSNGGAFA